MRKKTQGAANNQQRIAPTARPVSFCMGFGGGAFRALAILRGVRQSGKENVGLREAISIALEQGAAFKRWAELGTPIRRVQVWVENILVMTVSPEENTVNLKDFNFDLPSPRDAVMRIMKADEGEEPIVLRNLPLNTVPRCGLDETSELPNGQRIRLVIMSEEEGRYDIKVAFPPEKDSEGLRAFNRSAATAAGAGAAATKGSRHHHSSVATLLQQPRLFLGASACAFIFLLVVSLGVINGLSDLERQKLKAGVTKNKNIEASNPAVDGLIAASVPQQKSGTLREAREFPTNNATPRPVPILPLVIVADDRNAACPTSPGTNPANTKPAWNSPAPVVTPTEDLLQAINREPVQAKLDLPEKQTAPPEVFAAWDAINLPKLARLRTFKVRMDDTSGEKAELVTLHSTFLRALQDSAKWKVTDGSSDAVLKLRFEPDQSCLGVVLIEISDLENNRLWRAFVNCQDLQKQGHEAMFADASARLVNKLQDTLKLSENSENREERSDVETPIPLQSGTTK